MIIRQLDAAYSGHQQPHSNPILTCFGCPNDWQLQQLIPRGLDEHALTTMIIPTPRQTTFRASNLALTIQRLIIQVDESVFLSPNWRWR